MSYLAGLTGVFRRLVEEDYDFMTPLLKKLRSDDGEESLLECRRDMAELALPKPSPLAQIGSLSLMGSRLLSRMKSPSVPPNGW